jgi:hypothetical protein
MCIADLIAGASSQILPRRSISSMANRINPAIEVNATKTTTSTSSWNDGMVVKGFSVAQETEELLKMIFEKKEKVPLTSSSFQPKNAILLDSLLIKSAGSGTIRPTESGLIITGLTSTESPHPPLKMQTEKTKTDNQFSSTSSSFDQADTEDFEIASASTVSSVFLSTKLSLPHRQAKEGQTGRPNFFFLDDASSDFDSTASSFQSSRVSGTVKSDQATSTNPLEILASTTIDPFNGFYSVADDEALTQRLSSAKRKENSLTTTITYAVSSVSTPSLVSGHFSAQDVPAGPANKLMNKPQAPNGQENRERPPPNYPANQYLQTNSSIRRQGSVFSAPSPFNAGASGDENYDGQARSGGMMRPSRPVTSQPAWSYPGGKAATGQQKESLGAAHKMGFGGGDESMTDGNVPPPFQARPSSAIVDNGIQLETCSIGDDSTCSDSFNEVCRLDEDGAATCLCRMGSARLRLREECRGTICKG